MVDVSDTNVVLGFHWLYYIEKYTTNQQIMEIEFKDLVDGRRVVLRVVHQYPPRLVSSNSMEAALRLGNIEWSVECLIRYSRQSNQTQHHPHDI